ncbi:MAG TPA: glutamine synthetase family protein [Acidimicrobiales bacterium]|nr:glutamine synthetase family protein [Acidimicrobiales bacterium]
MTPGLLSVDDLRAAVAGGAIDTVICAFPDAYGRLLGKRLDAGFFLDDPEHGTHACDYLFTVDMEMEPIDGYDFASWDQGYGDVHLVPDLSTLRRCSWLDRTALVLCDAELDHEPVRIAPRSVLAAQVENASALGYRAMAASELEYFLYRDRYADAASRDYRGLRPAGWYIEDYHLLQAARTEDVNGALRRHLAASGIPVESTKGEWGRGQHEVNIRYCDVADMADRHAVLKHACKEIADGLGSAITFMAKPDAGEAGSSAHLHLSLWRGDVNVFASDETFRHFLGGWMAHAAELMVCWAPTVNSYKRYQLQSWAPTALAWSPDNRTAGFRIVGEGPAKRIECRIPGADVNPYLAYAAALASGLDGVANGTEPPASFHGDAYATVDLPPLPRSLGEAVEAFDRSDFARRAFGDDVVDHYVHFFRTEVEQFAAAVTDWERRRYFERI